MWKNVRFSAKTVIKFLFMHIMSYSIIMAHGNVLDIAWKKGISRKK